MPVPERKVAETGSSSAFGQILSSPSSRRGGARRSWSGVHVCSGGICGRSFRSQL